MIDDNEKIIIIYDKEHKAIFDLIDSFFDLIIRIYCLYEYPILTLGNIKKKVARH